MWLLILGSLILLTLAGFAFIVLKTTKFSILRNWKHRKLSILAAAVIWILVLTAFAYLTGPWNMMVSFMHLLIFWMIIEVIFHIVRKLRIIGKINRKNPAPGNQQPRIQSSKPYYAGRVAILFTIGYLAVGLFFVHHVFRTSYDIQTEHASGLDSVKVVGFSDSHVGATCPHWLICGTIRNRVCNFLGKTTE